MGTLTLRSFKDVSQQVAGHADNPGVGRCGGVRGSVADGLQRELPTECAGIEYERTRAGYVDGGFSEILAGTG